MSVHSPVDVSCCSAALDLDWYIGSRGILSFTCCYAGLNVVIADVIIASLLEVLSESSFPCCSSLLSKAKATSWTFGTRAV